MATPIVSAALDRPAPSNYQIGEVATLTVTYSDPDAMSNTITITGTDAEGHAASVTIGYNVTDPVTLTVSDSASRTLSKQSDVGGVAVYKMTV